MWIEASHTIDRRCSRGFTLLEILAAIFIFSIVMGLVFGTFGGVFSSADRVGAASDLHEMASACLVRMATDLKAIHVAREPRYKAPDMDDPPDPYRVEGGTEYLGGELFSRLRFTSLAHLPIGRQPREGIARIVYYPEMKTEGERILRRADNLFPYDDFTPSPTDPVICEQVLSFKVVYFDKEGRDTEEWNSESDLYEHSTPRAVGIELTLGDEQMSYTFVTEVDLPMVRSISRRR
ncbi:prepilin-type N-terminal cleavage/methylation domain-containing protein [Desulfatitalea alkaliphila]|uniref:Prepilin-type N-terminal cleavage/methylation domain-containing protein n=1 Tax=Desulfatitalea alkaliphila TaxID=2929485 RepID=A0AA41UIX9_9BACT|nr:prepilin-type N-terminal cleavage/methylation domain-containing protein [Desulfatitalea alkaliphila]MCJ8500579.1 prepilin-type N-terminal cleavage/methylation domain-containing protein [Desulfatitalea alkaliphila]